MKKKNIAKHFNGKNCFSLVSLTHEQKELSAATLYVCFSGANCVIIESEKEEETHLTILI